MFFERKDFKQHASDVDKSLDEEDDDAEVEIDNAINTPAFGHENGPGTTSCLAKGNSSDPDSDFIESLENRLCLILNEQVKIAKSGGYVKQVGEVARIGTDNKDGEFKKHPTSDEERKEKTKEKEDEELDKASEIKKDLLDRIEDVTK